MHPMPRFAPARPRRPVAAPPPALLQELLLGAVAVGTVLVLVLPGARDTSAAIGWLPLWLVGMPLAAWWTARRMASRAPG